MVSHILFDFDGTIADSRYLAIELLNQLAKKHGFRAINEEEFAYLRTISIIDRCKALQVPLYIIPVVFLELRAGYRPADLPGYNGLNEVIRELKQRGFVLSIISSNLVENINSFLRANNINLFDCVYSSSYFRKDAAINKYILKYKLSRKDVVYVGDEVRDIAACRLNRIKIIAVSWGYESVDRLAGNHPDFIANNPAELLSIITGGLE